MRKNPNVYMRLRFSRMGPGLPACEGYLNVWMKGARFRVRDETGRYFNEILGDIAAKRGLGLPPQTIEDIMDIWSRVRDETGSVVTELFGDLDTNRGWVYETDQDPWPIEAKKIAPAADQIFTDGLEKQLQPVKSSIRFGRACTEYFGYIEGEEEGAAYKSEIRRLVSPPFVFLNEVHDAEVDSFYFRREAVAFEEGNVASADVGAPSAEGNNEPE